VSSSESERKAKTPRAKKLRAKKPEVSQEELEAALDDLVKDYCDQSEGST
jgi:hypothetical protein